MDKLTPSQIAQTNSEISKRDAIAVHACSSAWLFFNAPRSSATITTNGFSFAMKELRYANMSVGAPAISEFSTRIVPSFSDLMSGDSSGFHDSGEMMVLESEC